MWDMSALRAQLMLYANFRMSCARTTELPTSAARIAWTSQQLILLATREGWDTGLAKRKSRWFHVAVRRRKTRWVSTGEELEKAGKEIGGGQREAVWFLNKNRRRRGKVIEVPWSTMARRKMWASSEHRFAEARAVRHSAFKSKSLKEQGIDLFIVANHSRQVPLGNHRWYGRAKMEQTSGKSGKIRMSRINGKRLL